MTPIQNNFPTTNDNISQFTIASSLKNVDNIKTCTSYEFNKNFPVMINGTWIYNFIPLKTIYGETVRYNGMYIAAACIDNVGFNLTDDDINDYYTDRKIRTTLWFFYSPDGLNWTKGGTLFVYNNTANETTINSQWTGTLVMREGSEDTFDVFWSHSLITLDSGNTNTDNPLGVTSSQGNYITHSSGRFVLNNGYLTISSMSQPTNIISPDDLNYATWWMNKDVIFQDPSIFVNPYDGNTYCIFAASVSIGDGYIQMKDEYRGTLNPSYVESKTTTKTGVIGLAKFTGTDFGSGTWTNLKPIISLCGVSSEAMIPTVLFKNGYTYVFFGLNSDTSNVPTGLYGMVSENGLFGDYDPINSDGKVMINSSDQPEQAFCHTVDYNLDVYSTIKYMTDAYGTVIYGFTPAPTTKIVLDRENSYIGTAINYGFISNKRDWSNIYSNSNPY